MTEFRRQHRLGARVHRICRRVQVDAVTLMDGAVFDSKRLDAGGNGGRGIGLGLVRNPVLDGLRLGGIETSSQRGHGDLQLMCGRWFGSFSTIT